MLGSKSYYLWVPLWIHEFYISTVFWSIITLFFIFSSFPNFGCWEPSQLILLCWYQLARAMGILGNKQPHTLSDIQDECLSFTHLVVGWWLVIQLSWLICSHGCTTSWLLADLDWPSQVTMVNQVCSTFVSPPGARRLGQTYLSPGNGRGEGKLDCASACQMSACSYSIDQFKSCA